eukprot:gene9919-18521_t
MAFDNYDLIVVSPDTIILQSIPIQLHSDDVSFCLPNSKVQDAPGPPFKRRKQSTLENFKVKGLSADFPSELVRPQQEYSSSDTFVSQTSLDTPPEKDQITLNSFTVPFQVDVGYVTELLHMSVRRRLKVSSYSESLTKVAQLSVSTPGHLTENIEKEDKDEVVKQHKTGYLKVSDNKSVLGISEKDDSYEGPQQMRRKKRIEKIAEQKQETKRPRKK